MAKSLGPTIAKAALFLAAIAYSPMIFSQSGRADAWSIYRPPPSWQPRHLEKTDSFKFALYGIPKDARRLRQYIEYLKKVGLAEAFDPGPTAVPAELSLYDILVEAKIPFVSYPPCSYFQVAHGGCEISPVMRERFRRIEDTQFHAIHLGEWDSFFHDLATDAAFLDRLYGSTRHPSATSQALRGYAKPPENGEEAMRQLGSYFAERKRALGERTFSVTGHSHYEAYAADWGADVIGIEVGVPAFTQSKIATARGASRNSGIPWTAQVSPWLLNSKTTTGPLIFDGTKFLGENAGHSKSFYLRMWLHAWFAGAAQVTAEGSDSSFFSEVSPKWKLSELGREAVTVVRLMKKLDRGTPYTPIAVVTDTAAGYNPYQKKSWGVFDGSWVGDEIFEALEQVIFPGSYNIREGATKNNPEDRFLVPTPFGEIFDVIRLPMAATSCPDYRVLLFLGDFRSPEELAAQIHACLKFGLTIALSKRNYERMTRLGETEEEVLARRTNRLILLPNPDAGGSAAFRSALTMLLTNESKSALPVEIEGQGIQFSLNRSDRGWIVELINNGGIRKRQGEAATVEAEGRSVRLRPKFEYESSRVVSLSEEKRFDDALELAPGSVTYVIFETSK